MLNESNIQIGTFGKNLLHYFEKVAEFLKSNLEAAAVFPNPGNIGEARELAYVEFLRMHIPVSCNLFKGGAIFDENGLVSKQIDAIVTSGDVPRFDLFNRDGNGVAHAAIEGALAAISVKSELSKKELFNALENIASIPATGRLDNRVPFGVSINNYDNWPYKIIFALRGTTADTTYDSIVEFYAANPDIPTNRRPDLIHVIGHSTLMKKMPHVGLVGIRKYEVEYGDYGRPLANSDALTLMLAISEIQSRTRWAKFISFDYHELINNAHLEAMASGIPEDDRKDFIATMRQARKKT